MDTPKETACGCHYKVTPRSEAETRQLINRINRIVGQLGGMKKMIEENRYCGDLLIQLAAAERALQSLGYQVLQSHMNSCVTEKVRQGDEAVMDELLELVKKLK